jgi:lipoate-protein ligase A
LCNGLVESFRRLGVPAGLTERDRGERSSACYLHASLADVSAGVRKLSGSAQVWRGDTVLQHGSFVRTRDIDRESRVFRLDERARERLASSTATLADLLPIVPDVEEMRRAVSLGVQDGLGVQLEEGELTGRERALEEEFLREAMKHGEIVRPLT